MAHDVVCFYEDRTGTTTFTPVAALADDVHTVSGDDVTVPFGYQQVINAWATLSNATDIISGAQVQAPSLRATSNIELTSLNVVAAGSAYAAPTPYPRINNFLLGYQSPRTLVAGEKMNMYVRSSAATANDLISGCVMLGNGDYSNPYVGMPVETLEFTAGAAAVANTWTTQTLAPTNQSLRAGRYAIVGMASFLTTGKVARLIMKEGGVARPGCYPVNGAAAGVDGEGLPQFRQGNMGVWGTFTHDNVPSAEVFCLTTDTAATTRHFLDIVKIQ